jgi:hypothetical protein
MKATRDSIPPYSPEAERGVLARDPDSLVIFTKHEEPGAFTVEMILRNLPPVHPFVVQWEYPQFVRKDGLDPSRLKQGAVGR